MTPSERTTTEAEEMYVITIARAIEDGEGPLVAVSSIATALDVSPVSANQMVKKLETMGLVSYVPYKGAALTGDGERLANVVLRSRRLWGVFLVDHLGMSPRSADEVACEMEHVTPGEVADRLSGFLGDPATGPTGKAIPAGVGESQMPHAVLKDIPAGSGEVILEHAEPPYGEFLQSQGLGPGDAVVVVASGPDGSMLVEGADGPIHLTAAVTNAVSVSKASGAPVQHIAPS
ncbi:MAG: metal-dependent transcriptional regulator [Acidimicrobiia bacterium]